MVILCILVLLYCGTAVPYDIYDGTSEDLAAVNLGTVIQKMGVMYMTGEHALTSYFIKLPNIASILTIRNSDATTITRCTKVSQDFNQDYQGLLRFWEGELITFVTNKRDILKQYITPMKHDNHVSFARQVHKRSSADDTHADHSVQRRSILGFLTGGLTSLTIGAVQQYELYRMKQHINAHDSDIQKIKTQLRSSNTQIIALKNQIIAVTKSITDTTSLFLQQQECGIFLSHLANKLESRFWKFRGLIHDTLWSAISADNNLRLNPRMLDITALSKVIRQHSELNMTIFNREPYLLYSLAKLSLIEISQDLSIAHFIISVPRILNTDTQHSLYKISQVGTFTGNRTCNYLHTPDYIFESENGTFHQIDVATSCTSHHKLFLCNSDIFNQGKSCLQRDTVDCSTKRVRCNDHAYHTSLSGIMIRNNIPDSTYITNNEDRIIATKLSNYSTTYINWKDITTIQFGGVKLYSPSVIFPPIEVANYTAEFASSYLVSTEEISQTFQDLCDRYNLSLNAVISPFVEFNNYSSSFWTLKNISIIILAAVLLFSAGLNAIIIIFVRKYYTLLLVTGAAKTDDQLNRATAPPSYQHLTIPEPATL